MGELYSNTLYLDTDQNEQFRLLYVRRYAKYAADNCVYLIGLSGDSSMPFRIPLQEFMTMVDDGIYQQQAEKNAELPLQLTKAQITARDDAWKTIGSFVENEPSCYVKKIRARFVSQKARDLGCSVKKISRLLHRYWAGGMTQDALIPQYNKRGGMGDAGRFVQKSLGRRVQKKTDNERLSIGEKERKEIEYVINKYYNKHTKYDYKGCYLELLNLFYRNDDGTYAAAYPTYNQFYYHALKFLNMETRVGTKKYNQNLRGLHGRGANALIGPGSLAQMDSTVLDCNLVLPGPGRKVIGRPTLYILVDVFSRIVMGFFLTIEAPSIKCVKGLLFNTASGKADFCARNGVQIKPDEWPCSGLPRSILTDNGKCRWVKGDMIPKNLGIKLANASSYRPDLKGAVERCFEMINTTVRMWTPGAVQLDAAERGAPDYRRESCLTLADMRQVIIRCICSINHRTMKEYPQDAEDLQISGVQPVPVDLWQWGIQNRGGIIREIRKEELAYRLLDDDKSGIVQADGIRFCGLLYTCQAAVEQNWFAAARQHGSWKVDVLYNPDNLDEIYIKSPEERRLQKCERMPKDREKYAGYSMTEYLRAKSALNEVIAKSADTSEQYQAMQQAEIRAIAEKARKRMENDPERKSPVKNVRENRAVARQLEAEQARNIPAIQNQHTSELQPKQIARPVPQHGTAAKKQATKSEKAVQMERQLMRGWGADDDEI